MPICNKCGQEVKKTYCCDHTVEKKFCAECYNELHYHITESKRMQ